MHLILGTDLCYSLFGFDGGEGDLSFFLWTENFVFFGHKFVLVFPSKFSIFRV